MASFNRLEGDSLIQTPQGAHAYCYDLQQSFNRLEGDSLIQTDTLVNGCSQSGCVSIALRAIL